MSRVNGILGATVILATCSLVSKLVSVAQEGAVASVLGASRVVDALLTARLVPGFFAGALGSTLAVAVIPLFQRAIRDRGSNGTAILLRQVLFTATGCFLAAFLCIVPVAVPITHLIAPGYSEKDIELAATLMVWSFPISLLECIGIALVGFLQAERRFTASATAALANAVVSIVAIMLWLPSLGIGGVLLGWGLGAAMQVLMLAWCLRKYFKRMGTETHGQTVRGTGVLQWIIPVFIGTVAANVVPFIERGLASGLEPGSIAVLNWAQKVLNLPLGLLALPMATAAYPFLAESNASDGDTADARARKSVVASLFVLVPASIALVLLRNEIVALIFMHGAFDILDVLRTGSAVGYYGLGLVGIGGFTVLSRVAYSIHDPWGPSIATAFGSLLYVPIASALGRHMGLPGLALAFSLVMLVACLTLGFRIVVRGRAIVRRRDASELVRIIVAGGAMAWGMILLRSSLGGIEVGEMHGYFGLAAVVLSGSLAYVIVSGLLGSETLGYAFGRLRRAIA